MGLFQLERVPEPEVMAEDEEVEAYASAAAARYLDKIDDTFVARALKMGVERGVVLDVGTGPGQIPIKIARRNHNLRIIGVDLSDAMIERARSDAKRARLYDRVTFEKADAKRLPFPDRSFDLVICNSLLHHIQDPVIVLNEMARVVKPEGAVLIRDLRRPSRLTFRLHVAWFGRHYTGLMRKLYEDSVRAAFTLKELTDMVARSRLQGARVYPFGLTHLVIERRRS